MSQEESQAIWAARGATPTPSQQGLDEEETEDETVDTRTTVSQPPQPKSNGSQANQPPEAEDPPSTSRSAASRDKKVVLDDGVTKGKESISKSAPKRQEQPEDVETREAIATLERINEAMANTTEASECNEKSTSHKDPGPKEDRGKQETTPNAETSTQKVQRDDNHGKKRSTKPVEKEGTKDRESTEKGVSSSDKTSMPRLNHNPPKKSIKDKDSTFERMPSRD